MTPPTTGGIRSDAAGDGHFGAPRGARTHRGVDYSCYYGEPVSAPIAGKVTRIAMPYANDSKFLGVEIVNSEYVAKMFYFDPNYSVIGGYVKEGDTIGYAQSISTKYNGPGKPVMTDHIHLQVKRKGIYVDPETL